MKKIFFLLTVFLTVAAMSAAERKKLNFNGQWLLEIGDVPQAETATFDDQSWMHVTLPYAFNGSEAFQRDIVDLTDTICWYRKHFTLTAQEVKGKVFIEFEGARQGADVWLNGQKVGFSDNGVMAFGFDLTPYVKAGENVMAVRCDNSWTYRDRVLNSRYQWNDKNFNANYGGLPKNVYLHLTDKLHQTLPLFSNLGTTGTYIYATDIDVRAHKAVVHVESEVKNDDEKEHRFFLNVVVKDLDGHKVADFNGSQVVTLKPGEKTTVKAEKALQGLHF